MSSDEQEQAPSEKYVVTVEDDAPPRDERQRLRVLRNGVVQREAVDCGEPEDQSFYRDWAWVPDALREAYAFGLADGQPMADAIPVRPTLGGLIFIAEEARRLLRDREDGYAQALIETINDELRTPQGKSEASR